MWPTPLLHNIRVYGAPIKGSYNDSKGAEQKYSGPSTLYLAYFYTLKMRAICSSEKSDLKNDVHTKFGFTYRLLLLVSLLD
jgi:hypothetical protein